MKKEATKPHIGFCFKIRLATFRLSYYKYSKKWEAEILRYGGRYHVFQVFKRGMFWYAINVFALKNILNAIKK